MRTLTLLLVLFCTVLPGCDRLEFSPNQKFDHDTPKLFNQANIEKLLARPGDDTIRFILSGDSQRSYDAGEKFVEMANQTPGLDFVLLDGDISDFGLLQEFEWMHAIYKKLTIPYMGIIGNHDYQGNGEEIFKKMYGETNFSFFYRGLKFICHDTNSRENEYNGTAPNLDWLASEFSDTSVNGFVAVAHVPPFSPEFDQRAEAQYTGILNKSGKLYCALYAHVGTTGIYYPHEQQVPYITTGGLDNRQYIIVEIINGQVDTQTVKF